MRYPTDTRYWVDEAVESLGYIKPEAAETLARLIDSYRDEPPKAIATRHRKDGPQVSNDDKKIMGIRSNGFLSLAARAELTEKGLESPLLAHQQTILRASLAVSRARRLSGEQAQGVTQWKFSGVDAVACKGCSRLADAVISASVALPIGPPDCGREACAVFYLAHVDYLREARRPEESRPASRWWKFW